MNEIKKWKNHAGTVLDSVNGFDVIECEVCGFKHIVPIPTAEEMEEAYREEYYSIEKPLYLERTKEDLDWWNIVYSERYDTFEEYLQSDRRRILDIGSGPGAFLLHGKQRGWQTLGFEPSRQAADHSRKLGLEIAEDFLTEGTAIKLGKFDVVHMSEVLEHILDPKGMLQLTRDLLTERGLVCVVVPNDYNPFQHALRASCGYKPWWVAPPHHINYFNMDSLNRLLSETNLQVVHKEVTFPIDIFPLMGVNYVGNEVIGRECHNNRKQFELNLEKSAMNKLKRNIYQSLSKLNIGRELIVFALKK
jgi:SAM-dependent methyltransferase